MRKILLALGALLCIWSGSAQAQFCPGAGSYVFVDVPADDPFCVFVTRMAVEGITEGCEIIDVNNRRYCPESAVTRKQMAAFLIRLLDRVETRFAVVAANGTLTRGRGVAGVTKLGSTGNYAVEFDRNLSSCAFVATIGPGSAGSALGEVNVALRSGNDMAIFVDTNTSSGTAADLPFHLVVNC